MSNYNRITQKITTCNRELYSFENSISRLTAELNELSYLKQKYMSVAQVFDEYNHVKYQQAKDVTNCIPNFRFAKSLSDSIINIVNGSSYQSSRIDIDDKLYKIDHKTQEVEQEISNCKASIYRLQNEISNLEYTLKYTTL